MSTIDFLKKNVGNQNPKTVISTKVQPTIEAASVFGFEVEVKNKEGEANDETNIDSFY